MSAHLVTKCLKVLLCLVAVGIPPSCTPTHHCAAGDDLFGPYTVPSGGNLGETLSKLRGFIWLHWHEQRRGCAEVTTTSMWEGVRCTNIYTVEADKDGRWYILDEWKCGPGTRGVPKATSGTSTWNSVQRVPEGGPGWRRNEPLPDSVDAPADSYVLVVKDLSGRTRLGL
jgi:hypothetical protein